MGISISTTKQWLHSTNFKNVVYIISDNFPRGQCLFRLNLSPRSQVIYVSVHLNEFQLIKCSYLTSHKNTFSVIKRRPHRPVHAWRHAHLRVYIRAILVVKRKIQSMGRNRAWSVKFKRLYLDFIFQHANKLFYVTETNKIEHNE